MPKKPTACSSNWNIKNFRHRSQNEKYWFKKKSNDMMYMEPNEKLQNYVIWSNKKRFLIFIIVFGKYFCFENFQKFQKIYATLFWWLASWVKPVACSNHELTQKVFATHLRVKVPVMKRLRKILKIWVFGIFATHVGDLFTSGSSNCEVT